MTGIFFRHLFTSIRKRPMQPILLILVIALSVAVCITAFHTRIFLREESQLALEAKNGIADFTVTFSSDSTMRFLFEDDIAEAIEDESAIICGSFTVPVYYGENEDFYYGIAADFNTVSDIFDISFAEYQYFHKNETSTSVFVSKQFAEETQLGLNNQLTINIMNNPKTFTIRGISENDLLGEYAVLMDITTLVGTIANNSMFVSLLGEDFAPSTKIFVHVDGDVDKAIADINETYGEGIIVNKVTKDAVLEATTKAIVLLIIMLAVFFAFAVIYVCFAVLTAQRQSENALFYAAGAKSYMLNMLSIAEMFIYWLVGGIVGIGLAYPISELFVIIGKFNYCKAHIVSWTIGASLAITLAAAEGSMCLFILIAALRKRKAKKLALEAKVRAEQSAAENSVEQENNAVEETVDKSGKKKKNKVVADANNSMKIVVIVIAVLSVAFVAIGLIDNIMIKKVFSIEAVFSILVAVFLGTKYLFPKVARGLSKLKRLPVTFRYAIKNASKVESLANTASVVALLIVIMGAIGLIIAYAVNSVEHDTNYLAGDYMVQNITDSGLDELRNSGDFEAIYGVYLDYGTGDDESLRYTLISASDAKGFSPHIEINELPTGNEVFMCEEIAMASHLKMGDELTLTVSGVEYTFIYSGNVKLGGSTLIINYVDMGLAPTFYEVIGKDGMTGEDVKQKIVSALTFESAVVVPSSAVTQRLVDTAQRYTTCVEFIAMFLVIFSLIGISDSIASSYRSRKQEFACYTSAGMNKKKIRNMKICEVSFAITFAFIIAVVSYALLFGDLHQVIRSFTENMFYVF